ncbi:MAG: hypothetical protein EXS14_04595 [Planctomycetes bacterium]|nr:hypothetical protein [Planctomycetota bacterium]
MSVRCLNPRCSAIRVQLSTKRSASRSSWPPCRICPWSRARSWCCAMSKDRSYEALAAILEIPPGTVRSRLFRARERLRPLLGERGT